MTCLNLCINYVQQSDFTIHSTAERLDQILKLDESCDYFYKIRIPQQIRKQLLAQLDAMGFHESSIYPDMPIVACVWTRRVMSLQAIIFCISMAAT